MDLGKERCERLGVAVKRVARMFRIREVPRSNFVTKAPIVAEIFYVFSVIPE
jgi:hypothetical protein